MRNYVLFTTASLLAASLLAACSSDTAAKGASSSDGGGSTGDADASTPPAADSGSEGGGSYVEPASCNLLNDTGGPGQYSDGCVKRSWIQDYAGKYVSASCELTIDITGSVAATFALKVLSGPLAGDYTTDWDGAPSPGNDSYYRFTTDTTFATTKTLNFTSGQKVGTSDERAIGLRVEDIDTGSAVHKGRYSQVIGGSNQEHDCGVMTKQ